MTVRESHLLDLRPDTDQTTRHGKVEVVLLGQQALDARKDGNAARLSLLVLCDDSRPDLDLLSELEDTGQDGSTGDASLELVDLCSRLVDVEGSDDDQTRCGCEISDGDGDVLDDVLCHCVDVVPQLGRDGDDRCAVGDGACRAGTGR